MFGNTLEDIIEMQRDRYPGRRLPWILTTLTEALLQQNGLQTEGIFRYLYAFIHLFIYLIIILRKRTQAALKKVYQNRLYLVSFPKKIIVEIYMSLHLSQFWGKFSNIDKAEKELEH